MRLRHAAPLALLSGLALTLTACSGSTPEAADKPTRAASAAPSTAAPSPETTTEPKSDAGAVAADLTQPGAVVESGEWLTYDWENYDGVHAVLQTRLTGITPATADEMAEVVAANPDFQGYQLVYVTWETRKVSGDSIEFNSSIGDFRPATVDGTVADKATAFGGPCTTDSFDEAFDTAGGTVTGCEIGLEIQGGQKVGGLLFIGPSAVSDSPFDSYAGEPVFLKG